MFRFWNHWKLGALLVHPQALALDVLSKEVEVRLHLVAAVCIAVAAAGEVPEPEEEPDEPEEEEEPEGDDLQTWICCYGQIPAPVLRCFNYRHLMQGFGH